MNIKIVIFFAELETMETRDTEAESGEECIESFEPTPLPDNIMMDIADVVEPPGVESLEDDDPAGVTQEQLVVHSDHEEEADVYKVEETEFAPESVEMIAPVVESNGEAIENDVPDRRDSNDNFEDAVERLEGEEKSICDHNKNGENHDLSKNEVTDTSVDGAVHSTDNVLDTQQSENKIDNEKSTDLDSEPVTSNQIADNEQLSNQNAGNEQSSNLNTGDVQTLESEVDVCDDCVKEDTKDSENSQPEHSVSDQVQSESRVSQSESECKESDSPSDNIEISETDKLTQEIDNAVIMESTA